jgi:hypothetical protein
MKIEDTLEQRGSIYGDYKEGVNVRADILCILSQHKKACTGELFHYAETVMFTDLVSKLVRFAGSPTHVDSIHDLAGYATLIERSLTCE